MQHQPLRWRFHVAAFPCSIDSGFPVPRFRAILRERGLPEPEAMQNLQTFLADKTKMREDYDIIFQLLSRRGFSNYCSKYRDSIEDVNIADLKGLANYKASEGLLFYNIAHGCDPSSTISAEAWAWRLDEVARFWGQTPEEHLAGDIGGGLVCYDRGFLAPSAFFEWLPVTSHQPVVVVIDACHSGRWADVLEELQRQGKYRHVILQAACRHDEFSFGGFFTPLWALLQGLSCLQLNQAIRLFQQGNWQGNPRFAKQNPLLVCRHPAARGIPGVVMECRGLRFFAGSEFFHFFAWRVVARPSAPRTLTDAQLLNAIGVGGLVVQDAKLKIIKNQTPELFLLVQKGQQLMALHVHFNSFAKLGAISGLAQADVKLIGEGLWASDRSTKQDVTLHPEHTRAGGIQRRLLAEWCKGRVDSLSKAGYFSKQSNWQRKATSIKGFFRNRSNALHVAVAARGTPLRSPSGWRT